ncbi:MAG: hypothetical protein M1587_11270 [Thaumarchaeota archaeon]|nr:hypothetical protein [Nitrososphaerota archaeon]
MTGLVAPEEKQAELLLDIGSFETFTTDDLNGVGNAKLTRIIQGTPVYLTTMYGYRSFVVEPATTKTRLL